MNVRALVFLMVFAALMVSPRIVEPPYYGFLVAFAALLAIQGEWRGIPLNPTIHLRFGTFLLLILLGIFAYVTWTHAPDGRDLLRDLGALFAFFVGRYLFIAYRTDDLQRQTLEAISAMGIMVAILTIISAFVAFSQGASAYIWRGEYIPYAHQWLPFALATNIFLLQIEPEHPRRWLWRSALCFAATVASLSRTDLLLELGFMLVMLWRFRHQVLLRFAGFAKLAGALMVFALFMPFVLQLDVVQARISRGVGENDQSVGWRVMEHIALYDHFVRGTTMETLFGFGFGARVPLPTGVLDFNNNTSMPTLHNSFGTIALKGGIAGVLLVLIYLWRAMRKSFALKDEMGAPYRSAGRWIVLLCVGKAITLHGLSEWSHLAFLGMGCMLMFNHVPAKHPTPLAHPA